MIYHYFSSKPKPSTTTSLIWLEAYGVQFKFKTANGVFSKGRVDLGSQILIKYLKVPEKGRVLDLGCGYGPIGIVLAKINPSLEVHMVDINPLAVLLARENAELNNVRNVYFHVGDCLDPVKSLFFKAIYSNPPLSAGYKVVFRMLSQSYEHLEPDGWLQIVIRKGVEAISRKLMEIFGNVETVAKESGYRVLISRKV
ncbi:MAG: class I SAM-dependent methyltransferase [Candidatus Methanomethylicota archaeon]|uniref:Class I SAM-dependent methyltransferase n=1 Tax=Thermoproteota archaeon TaxID=2056631 RepID=A0A497EQU5_9CREN|nr:MAG: class I SAM-dependent methyltransferase [Candidatus Verstraetearchaeota archaeon]RLE52469.1 MAG: class I SAM-dependent methyltransferase [Candidatus Verstraetearchaeota archaeon]